MTVDKEGNYYIKRKPGLMRRFDMILKLVKNVLIERFGDTKFEELCIEMRKEFETNIPQLPNIGGRKNRNYDNLINSALMLAVMRILEKEGLEFREIGKLCYELFEFFYKMMPKPPEEIFQKEYINQQKEDAKKSQLRLYSEDWVTEFVEGDGKTFDYGFNVIECGACKLFKRLNAEHLIPILCLADYADARASGCGLRRTQTISNGAPLCDFRYIKGGSTPRGWPPDNLQEFKKKLV